MDTVTGSAVLLSLIFEWFYDPHSSCSAELFSCSRVNSLWHGESCRLLWKHQYTLSHVTKLLRPDTALLSPNERLRVAGGSLSLQRFSYYARWITRISCRMSGNYSSLKKAILLSKGTAFPSLESVSFRRIEPKSKEAALALLSPRIKTLYFDSAVLPETALLIMSRLEGIQLCKLDLYNSRPSSDDRSCLQDTLRSQKSLLTLRLNPHWVNSDVLYAIGCLPNLSILDILNAGSPGTMNTICDVAVLRQLESRMSMFPSLKQLGFYSHYFVWKKLSNTIFTDTSLTAVFLDLQYTEEERSQEESVNVLSSRMQFPRLNEIDISIYGTSMPRVTARTLQPISKSHHLLILRLEAARIPNINNEELLSLAKYWPNITELLIFGAICVRQDDTYGISINIVGEITTICPKITHLALSCSSSVELELSQNSRCSALKDLDLGSSFLFDSQLADWRNRLLMIATYLAVNLSPSCHLYFHVIYNNLSHQMSDSEWSHLVDEHLGNASLILRHRDAMHKALSYN